MVGMPWTVASHPARDRRSGSSPRKVVARLLLARREMVTEKPLSEKEQRFVLEYVGAANGNGAAACRAAGYRGSRDVLRVQGSRMLAKANVRAAIAAHRAKVQADGVMTDTEVAVWLSGVVQGLVTEKKVTLRRAPPEGKSPAETPPEGKSPAETDDFVETEQAFDGKARITACGLLMKKMGYEAPTKQEHSGTVGLELTLTPEQDAALAEYLEMRDDPIIKARMAELRGEG